MNMDDSLPTINNENQPQSLESHQSNSKNGRSDSVAQRERFLEKFNSNEQRRIIKNVVILGFAFMIHFTAFHGTSNLQSSVNTDSSLGTITLASIYGSLIISNIFLPVIVISWLGCKWAITVSFIAYMPYIAAQFYPRFFTLLPAGLAVGFGGGPLWCAKCTYLSVIAEVFSSITHGKLSKDVLMVRFFGLFFVFYQMAQVWGNLISSAVLSSMLGEDNSVDLENTTVLWRDVGEICGANFCPVAVTQNDNPNLIPPDPRKIQLLAGIFLACMVTACVSVAVGVDSLKRYEIGRKGSGTGLSGFRLLSVTLRQLKHKYQLLLLPITMFIGAEQAFIAADFTTSFVACGWGISKIGYAMICFGISNAIGSALAGLLTKLTGRLPVMIGTMILHSALIIWMKNWYAVENDYVTYCIMAGVWGLADGIWLVQVNGELYLKVLF